MRARDIQMRDPFILVDGDRYILTGTTDADCWRGAPAGFNAYVSRDLINFEPAGTLFAPSPDFWGTQNYWAPELHVYEGAHYLIASFKAPGRRRGTSILRADASLGPYRPVADRAVTPEDWECLDGTLHVDDKGDPWLVFCHEWVQVGDGEICAVALSRDLSRAVGEPARLFTASQAPWSKRVKHSSGIEGTVTDGPFLCRPGGGRLWMLWSSLSETGYAIGQAISESGTVLGPWRQLEQPLFAGNGGHGMVFCDLHGTTRLAIHTPNNTPFERPVFLTLRATDEGYVLEREAQR